MDLKEEDILGDKISTHWYYVSKGRAMMQFLGGIRAPEVLDVGAGSGVFARQLLDGGVCDSAICVDPNYQAERQDTHNGKPIRFVRRLESPTQRLVLMMDVLEHVDDATALLRAYAPEDGHILITVPAFQFLWSAHDVFLEHKRRYSIDTLEAIVRDAGLLPIKSRYFFGSLFPAMAMIRYLHSHKKMTPKSSLQRHPDWLNRSLIAAHDLERHSLFHINKLFGLSVFCLCKR